MKNKLHLRPLSAAVSQSGTVLSLCEKTVPVNDSVPVDRMMTTPDVCDECRARYDIADVFGSEG